METRIRGPSVLKFWWRVSSEGGYDYLSLEINGVGLETNQISGEVNWEEKIISLPAGDNVVRWRYSKDSSIAAGSDAGWVDQISGSSITSETNSPAFTSTWIPLSLASNATGVSFEYTLTSTNRYTNETLVVMLGSNQLFFADTADMDPGVPVSTGVLDISRFAGTNSELFVSLQGETNTIGQVTLSNLKVHYPSIVLEALENQLAVRWSMSHAIYALESSTNLVTWTAISEVPVISATGFNEVLLPMSVTPIFFRLVRTGEFLPPEEEFVLPDDYEEPPPIEP